MTPDEITALAATLRQINRDNPGQRQDYVNAIGQIEAVINGTRSTGGKVTEIDGILAALRLSRSDDPLPPTGGEQR